MQKRTRLAGMNLFWSKVQKTDGCWYWLGRKTNDGYPRFSDGRYHNTPAAHRIAYVELRGDFDRSLTLDHLCHTNDPTCLGGTTCPHRGCVNPDHLEPVSAVENVMRGLSFSAANARRTACKKCGQPYDAVDREGYRTCGPCVRAYQAAWQRTKRALATAERKRLSV